jgi:catechol 2,3-dioxygenase-like lactoylglutathione lyase family enzyme
MAHVALAQRIGVGLGLHRRGRKTQAAFGSGCPRRTLRQSTREALRALHYARSVRPRRRPSLLRRGPRLAIRLRRAGRDHLYPGRPRPALALFGAAALEADIGRTGTPTTGPAPFTLAQVADTEDEVIAVLDAARAAGATILKPAQRGDFGGFHGYFADPDGFRWRWRRTRGGPWLRMELSRSVRSKTRPQNQVPSRILRQQPVPCGCDLASPTTGLDPTAEGNWVGGPVGEREEAWGGRVAASAQGGARARPGTPQRGDSLGTGTNFRYQRRKTQLSLSGEHCRVRTLIGNLAAGTRPPNRRRYVLILFALGSPLSGIPECSRRADNSGHSARRPPAETHKRTALKTIS